MRPGSPSPRPTPGWRRRLSFTRLGRWYCALTLGIGFAAINTGNNLLFLVLGLLLSSIVVSGVLSESAVRDLCVERLLPPSAWVGMQVLVGLRVRNEKRWAPSFSLELRESDGEVSGGVYVLWLDAGEGQERSYRFVPRRRGRHRFARLEVATRSPFGLFEKCRPVDAGGELIVFPRRVPARAASPSHQGRDGDAVRARPGPGLEMYGVRDHRPFEDARAIQWRLSARAGRLLALEREEEGRRRVCVLLDHRLIAGTALESAVEDAAALFEQALDQGAEVGLALCGTALPPGSGPAHLRAGLTALALVERAPHAPPPVPPEDALLLVAWSAG